MHIPDGYLGPATYSTLWGVMLPFWWLASGKVKRYVKSAEVPYLAMGTVFSLVAMLFVLPIPGGTTGHISGTALVAILLGPWAAIVAVSVSIAIQALVMGDGGITAIAANCFNIAVIGAFSSAALHRFILAVAHRLVEPTLKLSAAAAAVAAYLSVNAGALSTACLLGLQPTIYGKAAGSGYFPFPLEAAIPATMLPHLSVVGALEATVTALVIIFLNKKGFAIKAGKTASALLLIAVMSLFSKASAALAHDYWIEKWGDGFAVVYGHGDQRLKYDPNTLTKVMVYNSGGKALEFKKELQTKGVIINPVGAPCLILADMESGYWSKTIYGLKNLPKRKATRPVESFKAHHYSKSIVSSGDAATKPVEGLKLDIIPLKNPLDLKIGDTLQLKVLFEGKPLAGAYLEGDHKKAGVTDKDGVVKITLKKGRQIYTVLRRDPLKNDPDADFVDISTTLTFEVTR